MGEGFHGTAHWQFGDLAQGNPAGPAGKPSREQQRNNTPIPDIDTSQEQLQFPISSSGGAGITTCIQNRIERCHARTPVYGWMLITLARVFWRECKEYRNLSFRGAADFLSRGEKNIVVGGGTHGRKTAFGLCPA